MGRTDPALRADLAVLGLPETASRADVVKTYRRLARLNHPDLSPAADAAQRFAAIDAAYRRAVDRLPVQAPLAREVAPVERRRNQAAAEPPIIAGPVRIERSTPSRRPRRRP